MNASSRYWKIWQISLVSERIGYKARLVPTAQEFLGQFSDSQIENIQTTLLSYFHEQSATNDSRRATAGLCLRCYVSSPILRACQKIDSLFAGDKSFTYRDLLPFVLNDDGQTPIVLDRDGNQLVIDHNGQTKTATYPFFSVKVLQTYKHDSPSRMSLDNWTYLQTKQNRELKNFLSEFGFKPLSDWALLNRARTKQLQQLSVSDRHLVEVFHAVYRRDRRKQPHKGARRCSDPNEAQLQEMLTLLPDTESVVNSSNELLKALKQVAIQLRQYDVWSYREPLEIQEPDTGSYVLRSDLPYEVTNEINVEQQELVQFLHQQFQMALERAIAQEIQTTVAKLQKSKRYAPLALQYIPGLQLYYGQGKSLKEIVPQLGMTSWDQARRVLNPGDLLSRVRASCTAQLLERLLKKAQEKGLTKLPPEPDYLKTLAKQIEAFADEEVFQEAAAEIKTGKNRSLNSVYAEQLRFYIEKPI